MTIHLRVSGMTCGGCATSVTSALRGVAGVTGVVVDLAKGSAAVELANERPAGPHAATHESVQAALLAALQGAGFEGTPA